MSESLSTLFRRAAARWREAPAVLAEPVWTYAHLDRASDAVAAGLIAHGIEPGERVALLCPNGADWASVRLCISGGAALPQSVMERFEKRYGVPILEGDGPTECGPVTAVNPPSGPRKPSSIGPPIPGVEMRICDPLGRELRTAGERERGVDPSGQS